MTTLAVAACLLAVVASTSPAAADPATLNGSGTTLSSWQLQSWLYSANQAGVPINYLPSGSAAGIESLAQGVTDFAVSEMEVPSVYDGAVPFAYQYAPLVTQGLAVVVNMSGLDSGVLVPDGSCCGYPYPNPIVRPQIRLSSTTIARIFMGDIVLWSDAAIAADNPGVALPVEPINVVYRDGEDGVTGQFYDFVGAADPALYDTWTAANGFAADAPITDVGASHTFAPRKTGLFSYDQISQFSASGAGRWSIAYVPASYAKQYGATPVAVINDSGRAVRPTGPAVTAALRSATQNEDTSLDLTDVYASTDPGAYPIPLIDYMVLGCSGASGASSCAGGDPIPSVKAAQLRAAVRYLACAAQSQPLEYYGFAQLPGNLSQFSVDTLARLNNEQTVAETLDPATCQNPAFNPACTADPLPAPTFVDVPDSHPFCAEIERAYDKGIIAGFGGWQFQPSTVSSRQATAAFLFKSVEGPDSYYGSPYGPIFSDVGWDNPNMPYINWSVLSGISGGYGDGTFRPYNATTRQALAAQIFRVIGPSSFVPPVTPTFNDVGPLHPFYREIEYLAAIGVVQGYPDGGFHPAAPVTRQAAVVWMDRAAVG